MTRAGAPVAPSPDRRRMQPLDLAVLPLAAFLVLPVPGERPSHAPREGVTIEARFEHESTNVLAALTMQVGDDRREVPDARGAVEVSLSKAIAISDEVAKVEDGRATRVVRRFEEVAGSIVQRSKGRDGDQEETRPQTSDLEGKTVVFTWDAEQEEYARAYEGGGDEDLLEGLEPAVDFAAWLPAEAVEEGDTWTISTDAFKRAILRPAGDMEFHGEEARPPIQDRLDDGLWEALEGEITATWEGVREEGDRRLGVIAFEGELSARAESSREGEERGPDSVSVENEDRYEGELLWDLADRRAHSLSMKAKGTLTRTEKGTVRPGGEERAFERTFEFETEDAWSASFEAR